MSAHSIFSTFGFKKFHNNSKTWSIAINASQPNIPSVYNVPVIGPNRHLDDFINVELFKYKFSELVCIVSLF